MDWFNGTLLVTFVDGTTESIYDISFQKANEQMERLLARWGRENIRWAIYTPSPCSMV